MKIIVCFSMLHMVFGAAKPDWWCVERTLQDGAEGPISPLTTRSVGYKTCTIGNTTASCTKFVFDESEMRTVVSEVFVHSFSLSYV